MGEPGIGVVGSLNEGRELMNQDEGLIGGALRRVGNNKRYIFWFYVLNVTLAWLGAGAFGNEVHEILDHSLRAERLLHGFDLGVFVGMFMRPEFGSMRAASAPAMHFAVLYFLLTALFMPGVLQGYASNFRLPRDEFFRACGRNLWRFVRLMIVAAIVMAIAAGALFGIRSALLKKATESTNELLPFYVSLTALCVIFLIMTGLRICFDLAEADVVLSDQHAVRKSIAAGFRHTWRSLGRLLGAYVLIAIAGIAILVAGIFSWIHFVPSASVFSAVIVSQLILLLLLIARFWQRGVAVTYYLQSVVAPIPEKSFAPSQIPPPVVAEPAPVAVMPNVPPEPAGS
jgi:type III secretory pathway component EscS